MNQISKIIKLQVITYLSNRLIEEQILDISIKLMKNIDLAQLARITHELHMY